MQKVECISCIIIKYRPPLDILLHLPLFCSSNNFRCTVQCDHFRLKAINQERIWQNIKLPIEVPNLEGRCMNKMTNEDMSTALILSQYKQHLLELASSIVIQGQG